MAGSRHPRITRRCRCQSQRHGGDLRRTRPRRDGRTDLRVRRPRPRSSVCVAPAWCDELLPLIADGNARIAVIVDGLLRTGTGPVVDAQGRVSGTVDVLAADDRCTHYLVVTDTHCALVDAGDARSVAITALCPKRSLPISMRARAHARDRRVGRARRHVASHADLVRLPSRQLPSGIRDEPGLQRRTSAVRQSHRHVPTSARSHHRSRQRHRKRAVGHQLRRVAHRCRRCVRARRRHRGARREVGHRHLARRRVHQRPRGTRGHRRGPDVPAAAPRPRVALAVFLPRRPRWHRRRLTVELDLLPRSR